MTTAIVTDASPAERFDAMCDELADLCGQANAIAGRITELLGTIERDELLGGTGVKSLESFCTWKLGVSMGRARQLCALARRADELPRTVSMLRDGRLSEDQAGVIARMAPAGTDDHYADLAEYATVGQLRRALRLASPPGPQPRDPESPDPAPPTSEEPLATRNEVTAHWDDDGTWTLRARLAKVDGAVADSALASHLDALVNEWRRERDEAGRETTRPFPTLADAFLRMVGEGLDGEAERRPHGHRTTVVLHVDIESKVAGLHLGPALSEAERRYLSCDAKVETWFERSGVPIGCGRQTREISRRLRRALERRSSGCCEVPGCETTRGLHGHHIVHWEDGGPTELWNLYLVCGFHHRLHHAGGITIRGRAPDVTVVDHRGRKLSAGGLTRPPNRPPLRPRAPYAHPTGEHFDFRWYDPPSLS